MKKRLQGILSLILAAILLTACGVMPEKPAGRLDGGSDRSDTSSERREDRSDDEDGSGSQDSGSGSAGEEPGDTSAPPDSQPEDDLDLDGLWTKIKGIWGVPDMTKHDMGFDVFDYDENGNPVNYYVWGFEPSSSSTAVRITALGDNQYEVVFQDEEDDEFKAIFDLNELEQGELIITSLNTGAVLHYICWGHEFEEVYDKLHVYD